MPRLVWLNGCLSPLEEATTHVADHAHLYGDGLFEGIRIYARRVFKLDEHLERAYFGCKYLGYEMSIAMPELRAIILDVCKKADIDDGYIRLNITRGTGLGLDPRAVKTAPNVMVMVSSLSLYPPEAYETGLEVITTSYRVINPDALDPRLKCIGRYASNIMAKAEANRAGAGEGLMLNAQGHVAEATGDNIFVVQNGVLRTPHRASGILQGITRATAIELAQREGVEVREETLTRWDIFSADEAFLTGTAAEIIAMVSLDTQPIGDGKPGPLTKRLTQLYREETRTGTEF
ncbi:MAG: branched-chain-amino-acid transaminase [Fimbriimonadaceae bacterium]|nr:branched-chain-amino-acid transaminase [Fimbriimonadaceae bacterium]QYK55510.1 MAG: branched-chain-amino-acid transaminase [Fimbriimonadaceae bacterium]